MTTKQHSTKTKTIAKEEKVAPEIKQSPMQQLPLMQDLLNIPIEEREERCRGYHEKIKPFLHQYAQKKMGSRVLQLIFKWGDKDVKESILKITRKYWKTLIKSKYSLYLIEHVAKEFNIPEIA